MSCHNIFRSVIGIIIFSFLIVTSSFAQSALDKVYENLARLEQQQMGQQHKDEPITNRLDRLEQKVFGKKQVGSPQRRLDSLLLQADSASTQPTMSTGPAPVHPAMIWQKIYDGRGVSHQWSPTHGETMLLRSTVLPSAEQFCHEKLEGFLIIAHCAGAFTRKGSHQTAYIYSLCPTDHDFTVDGIAVAEGQKIVANLARRRGSFASDGPGNSDIITLPDLNGDGLNEFAAACGGTQMGITWGVISIYGISPSGLHKYGNIKTCWDNGGSGEKKIENSAWVVFVKPGIRPTFGREKYIQGKKAWLKVGNISTYQPEADEADYKQLSI